jgi:hypothetical protein
VSLGGGLKEAGLEGAEVRGKGLVEAGAREVGTEGAEERLNESQKRD